MTSSTSCQRFELLSSGLKSRKFRDSMFIFMTSRKKPPITRVELGRNGARCGHLDTVITEIREPQLAEEQAPIRMWVGAHAAVALRGEFSQLRPEAAAAVEELSGLVALHPAFEDPYVGRILVHLPHRHLVRAPIALSASSVDLLWASPALWSAKHDHRPAGAFPKTIPARVSLDALDLADDNVESVGHQLVHLLRFVPLNEIGRVAITAEEMVQLLVADPGQDAGIGDLVAVQVKDRQNRPVGGWVQKLIRVPTRRQRSGLGLAVADDTGDDQIGVVEGGP